MNNLLITLLSKNKHHKHKQMIKLINILVLLIFIVSVLGDARKVPVNADERVKRNLKKARIENRFYVRQRWRFFFASSNRCRASLEKLNFIPLNNVDYRGYYNRLV